MLNNQLISILPGEDQVVVDDVGTPVKNLVLKGRQVVNDNLLA